MTDSVRILMIEDDRDHVRLMREWLRISFGYAAVLDHCSEYADGLELLCKNTHDVCLLDYRLGTSSGLELLHEAQNRACRVPVILMTAYGDREVDMKASQLGAADYLDKMCLTPELLERSIRYSIRSEAMRRKQLRLSSVLEATTDFVGTFDSSSQRFTYLNNAALNLLGIPQGYDLTKLDLERVYATKSLEKLQSQAFQQALRAGAWSGDVTLRHQNGSEISAWMVLLAHLDSAGNVEYYSTVTRDLTGQNRARAEIAALASFADDHVSPLLRVDLAGQVLYANRAAQDMLGCWNITIGEQVGNRFHGLLDDLNHTNVTQQELSCASHTYLMTASLVPEAAYINIYGIDISDRKVAEANLRKAEDQVRQSQKMEAIGRLAGGIAHDFNNILTIINGYCELLLQDDSVPVGEGIGAIKDAALRAAALTRQLLAFGRKQLLIPERVILNSVIIEMKGMLGRLLGEDIYLQTRLDERLGFTLVDLGQLQQVVMNLAINARDAMPLGGTLTLETRRITIDESQQGQDAEIKPGKYILLTVTDTGCGMDDETRSFIFEPFFSTKPEGSNTGLGLSTVFGIIKQSEGYINVHSKVGEGTTFRIFLPECDPPPEQHQEVLTEPSTAGSETILLVEDEPRVRNVAQRILESFGYRVLAADCGQAAELIVDSFDGNIDLLLSDVVLPGGSGPLIADKLRKRFPDLKVIFMSGYTDDAIERHGVADLTTTFIQKPFSANELTAKVRRVLDGRFSGLPLKPLESDAAATSPMPLYES